MNRQRIRVIALVALVVAAGAYVWAQRAATTVKPAQTATTTAATKKPGNVTQPAKPPAPAPANTKNTAAPAPVSTPGAAQPAATAASKTAAPIATAPGTPAPAVDPKAASNVSAPAPVAAPPAPAAVVPAAATASWQDRLQKGSFLAEKLRPRLPEGTDLLVASDGFRDLQQFVATATAAHNLKLNFEELKRRVVTDHKGLASAIDAMKKVASATIEEQRAEYEARGLVREAERQPLPATPPVATKAATKNQPKKSFRTPSGS